MSLQKEVALQRIINHRIGSDLKSKSDLIRHMGALQAQDLPMSLWAIGCRTGKLDAALRKSFASGEFIRTHLMRPTWHIVAPSDIEWIIDITADRIRSRTKTRRKQLGLTPKFLDRCLKMIDELLLGKGECDRNDIGEMLKRHKIDLADNRLAHILMEAELDKLVCSGKISGNRQTYVLYRNRVTDIFKPDRNPAAELLKRFLSSHGPATLGDFIWWSGLTITLAKEALEEIRSELQSVQVNESIMWFVQWHEKMLPQEMFLLPAFDEFVIAYKDRAIFLPDEQHSKAVSRNGVFWPVILENGQAIGTWKRKIKGGSVHMEFFPFDSFSRETRSGIREQAEIFAAFLEKELQCAI